MSNRQDSYPAYPRSERFPARLQFDQHALRDLPLITQDLDIIDFQPAGRCTIQVPDALHARKINEGIRAPASGAGSRQFIAIHQIIRSPRRQHQVGNDRHSAVLADNFKPVGIRFTRFHRRAIAGGKCFPDRAYSTDAAANSHRRYAEASEGRHQVPVLLSDFLESVLRHLYAVPVSRALIRAAFLMGAVHDDDVVAILKQRSDGLREPGCNLRIAEAACNFDHDLHWSSLFSDTRSDC